METFKLVSKMTAKHLFNRLKGKSEPIDRSKKAAPAAAAKPSAVPAMGKVAAPPPPVMEEAPPITPFPDVPFPEATENPLAGYEKAEEVSLEQLLQEGRERPATFAGTVAVPIDDDVEEIGAEHMVEDTPAAVGLMDEPFPAKKRSAGGADVEAIRKQHRADLESILRDLEKLTARVRQQLG